MYYLLQCVFGIAVLAVLSACGILAYDAYRFRRLPPSPPKQPFLGNKNLIPKSRPWLQMEAWSKEYGPMYTLWQGRNPTIVISDPQIAVDLMEKRSIVYSSRPRMVVMGDIFTQNKGLLTAPYGEYWRRLRKINHLGLMSKAALSYRPVQSWESMRLVHDLATTPHFFERHIQRYAASVVMTVAYARRVDSMNDPDVQQILTMMQYMASLNVPGRYLAESLPILARVPDVLAPWKADIKVHARKFGQFFIELGERAIQRYNKGELPHCFLRTLMESRDKYDLSEDEICRQSAGLFGAGSDTSSATMTTFILAMTVFGRDGGILARAQEELDRVVGRRRSPTWDDEPNLPYVRAVVKETFRWRPVAVLGGTPHANTEDDIYNGFFIPKGTTILSNFWAMNHNEAYFPEPHTFRPERYLDEGFVFPMPQGYNSFGFGRRVCPGQLVAEQSLFITVSRILWAFNIYKAVDAQGKEIEYDTWAYSENFNTQPLPFKTRIEPRGPEFLEVLGRDYNEALGALEIYKPTT